MPLILAVDAVLPLYKLCCIFSCLKIPHFSRGESLNSQQTMQYSFLPSIPTLASVGSLTPWQSVLHSVMPRIPNVSRGESLTPLQSMQYCVMPRVPLFSRRGCLSSLQGILSAYSSYHWEGRFLSSYQPKVTFLNHWSLHHCNILRTRLTEHC